MPSARAVTRRIPSGLAFERFCELVQGGLHLDAVDDRQVIEHVDVAE